MTNYTYKALGATQALPLDDGYVAVRFKEPAKMSVRKEAALFAGIEAFADRIEVPNEKITVVPVAKGGIALAERSLRTMAALDAHPQVARSAPVFKLGEKRVVATDRALFGFKQAGSDNRALLEQLGGTVTREDGAEYVVQLPEGADPFDYCNRVAAAKPDLSYAEPDFAVIGRHLTRVLPPPGMAAQASDPLLASQYAPRITNAVDAWTIQSGIPSVQIAILDEGVDTGHPDLKGAIVATFDAIDRDSFQDPNSWDGHGTACAGLAAAIPDNNAGIRGIGGGCSLMAARIAYSNAPHGPWVFNDLNASDAIDWAWQNGASVLSNSWGGGPVSGRLAAAFERARTQGRGGRGCVIVFAAGNKPGPVMFPATLPNVLAVSATNEYDEFKTPSSRDGEHWWGSSFGPEIAVAAPGVHNMTTDISGTAGYDRSDYYAVFNGTSSATPIVAGAAGLLLSANPSLTEAQVRDIIKQTADKIGPLPYTGGRNDQFGHGRLNVLNAVLAARNGAANP
ncbi:MAG: S8 family serine peptidase [Rhizomicrobium sp.]